MLLTRKGDAQWVKTIAGSAQLLTAVRCRAGCEESKGISKPLSLVKSLPRCNSTEASEKQWASGEDRLRVKCKLAGSELVCTTQGQDGGVMLNDSMKTLAQHPVMVQIEAKWEFFRKTIMRFFHCIILFTCNVTLEPSKDREDILGDYKCVHCSMTQTLEV